MQSIHSSLAKGAPKCESRPRGQEWKPKRTSSCDWNGLWWASNHSSSVARRCSSELYTGLKADSWCLQMSFMGWVLSGWHRHTCNGSGHGGERHDISTSRGGECCCMLWCALAVRRCTWSVMQVVSASVDIGSRCRGPPGGCTS
eukprot:scaffold555_cov292-Prasinococcus_capsulatus_cf.AAC.4